MRNEPVVMDVGDSFIGDVERIRSNYQRKVTFSSDNKDCKNVEEGEHDIFDFGNVSANLDIGESSVGNIEQMHSLYFSDVEN